MAVTVHYHAQLRRAAGCATETLDLGGDVTVAELLGRLAQRHDEAFRALLFSGEGRPQASLLVFVRDQAATEASIVRDGDEVTILTPMAGG
jgi:molybdopterin converting factor small subunit